ncbi:MAG: adenylosuccinate synthase [Defluviitaleaceae bacterium]|nr:adenylosuccinate synthase [Defluviitaleaceae bacterium]MCL2274049.1 adenylosuccinate synthase [Defluviitaleaceae bacterium]
MHTAVVGINWGDEGKGRMVDLLCAEYDIICRYQGGNNAGHTVINDRGKFVLNLLPSGILRADAVNIMGAGMVIDLAHLVKEIESLSQQGVKIFPKNLKISDKAFVCMPWHVAQDVLEEERLGDKKYGSTRRGIAPVYGDKYMKKGIRMGDLAHPKILEETLQELLAYKLQMLSGYGYKESTASITRWVSEYGEKLQPFVADTGAFLQEAAQTGKAILYEAQLGALRDIDYGIYPFTTSSNTLAAYAPIGAGLPSARLDKVIGVMKAYSSCVGEGPFTAEIFGEEAEALRKWGAEYGAATGRPRRVGGFDIPASRYGVQVQGATELALTKLDVLAGYEKIPVCIAYEVNGKVTRDFPTGESLRSAKPVYEYWEGFSADISHCRTPEDLPASALAYVRKLEDAVQCPITYVSVGAGREDYLRLR